MSLIKCSECGREFSDKAAACPNCGCPIDDARQETSEIGEKKSFWGKMVEQQKIADEKAAQRKVEKASKSGLKCPKCKSHNIDLWSDSVNMKEFERTSLNLNPLHPLTPFKTKTVKKEKKSAAKIGLGVMTGGASLLVTGTTKKKHNEYYCRDCGNRWVGK